MSQLQDFDRERELEIFLMEPQAREEYEARDY